MCVVGVGWGMTGKAFTKCLYAFLKVFSDLFIPLAMILMGMIEIVLF